MYILPHSTSWISLVLLELSLHVCGGAHIALVTSQVPDAVYVDWLAVDAACANVKR